jgi:hypothetical protein
VAVLVVAIGVVGDLVVDHESAANRRWREIAKAAEQVPPCGQGAEIHTGPAGEAPPGLVQRRVITCGPPDQLGDLVVVERYATHAAVVRQLLAGRREKDGVAQCATKLERFDLLFSSNDAMAPHSVRDERGWDRAFCKRVGAGRPEFTQDYLLDNVL